MPKKPIDPKTQALKLLARREHSARELKRKLTARGISADDAASAVARAAAEGWQDDSRYAEMLVRTRVAGGYGPVRIEAELEVAGVPSEQIRAALDGAGVDWREQAAAVHAKKFGRPPKSSAERAKQYRYLQSRGFDSGQIQAVLKGEHL
ncbi:MAG: regulatory protein RecX [Dongiaceae bacterium]